MHKHTKLAGRCTRARITVPPVTRCTAQVAAGGAARRPATPHLSDNKQKACASSSSATQARLTHGQQVQTPTLAPLPPPMAQAMMGCVRLGRWRGGGGGGPHPKICRWRMFASAEEEHARRGRSSPAPFPLPSSACIQMGRMHSIRMVQKHRRAEQKGKGKHKSPRGSSTGLLPCARRQCDGVPPALTMLWACTEQRCAETAQSEHVAPEAPAAAVMLACFPIIVSALYAHIQ